MEKKDKAATSDSSKISRIKDIIKQWDWRYTTPKTALHKIKNILED